MAFMGGLGPDSARAVSINTEASPVVSDISIEILGTYGPTDRLRAFAEGLVLLRKGEPFSDDGFQQTLGLLKSSGLFQAIDVPDPDWSKGEIILTFRLTPFRRIKDIKIHGAFPLLQREVLNAMTIFTGDAFVPGKLKEQETLIEKAFIREGYTTPKVKITSEEDPDDGHFIIIVTIDKGDFLRIQHVEIHGNKAFSGTRLKLRIDSWKASLFWGEIPRFIEKKLQDDVKNLTDFYRNEGYADVEVSPSINRLSGTNDMVIHFLITEGKKYKIHFEGNEEFWDYTLKKELALSSGNNQNDLGLKRGVRNIRNRYKQAGYLDARVRMSETDADDETRQMRTILFTIEEGPRYLVDTIAIEGNTVFDDERIEKQMLTRTPRILHAGEFVPDTLAEDVSAIHSLYLRSGYLSIDVQEKVTWRDGEEENQKLTDVTLVVDEGVQTKVTSIVFNGLSGLTDAKARAAIALQQGEPFREYMVESDENTLSELISEKGFPHVTIKGKVTIDKGRDGFDQASVTFEVEKGPHVKTGRIFYTGNFRTRERILQREVELTKDAPFSLTETLETQRNIRNINALNSATFSVLGLKEKTDQVNLLVEVEEKKPYFFEFGAGYDTRREKYVHARLGDQNLFGLNKSGWISSETSDIGYRHELGITEPRFLGTRISSTFSMFAEDIQEFNQEFGTRTFGTSLAFNRRFLERFNATLTNRYEYRDQYHVGSEPIAPEDLDQYEPRSLVVTTPSIAYNTTESFIQPKDGLMTFAALDLSKGIENTLDNFIKHRYELRYYYTPVDRLTFALRGRYHFINPYGSNHNIAEDQLLFLGGVSDVRGFSENMLAFDAEGNPVGGRTAILGSVEARFDLGLNVEFTTFYDTGSLRDLTDPTISEGFRSSAGVGLRYVTPIGPVGFLYGWKLDRKPDESAGNFHFSIGYTF